MGGGPPLGRMGGLSLQPPLMGQAPMPGAMPGMPQAPAPMQSAPQAAPPPPLQIPNFSNGSTGNPLPIPAMQMPNYNQGGGYNAAPVGGMWNQIAQRMAGPMFLPNGSPPSMSSMIGAPNGGAVMPNTPRPVNLPPLVGNPSAGNMLGQYGGPFAPPVTMG
jgi:hypothetical protein